MPERPRRRALSIGARWTLRYGAAVMVSVSALSFYAYTQLQLRAAQDARLLLELQATGLIARVKQGFANVEELDAYITDVVMAESDLKLSVQVFDSKHERIIGRGLLRNIDVELPAAITGPGAPASVFDELEIGRRYPYWVSTSRAGRGFVQVGAYSREFVRPVRALMAVFLTAIPVAVAVTLVLGWWLARASLRPLSEITATARRITGSNLDEPIPGSGTGDELDELAKTLDDMRVRIRDSVAKMSHFTVDAAHQLRTPLTKLRSRLEVTLESEEMSPSVRKVLEDNLEEIDQLAGAVTAMLQLASSEAGLAPGQGRQLDLAGLLASVAEFYEPMAADREIALAYAELARAPETPVIGDVAWLRQLFANLVENAIRHTPPGGRIALAVASDSGEVRASVSDTGRGIRPQDLQRIFDRFHRGPVDEPGRSGHPGPASGVGLGLTIATQIARAHGGELDVESQQGTGTTFTVRLPAAPGPQTRSAAPTTAAHPGLIDS